MKRLEVWVFGFFHRPICKMKLDSDSLQRLLQYPLCLRCQSIFHCVDVNATVRLPSIVLSFM